MKLGDIMEKKSTNSKTNKKTTNKKQTTSKKNVSTKVESKTKTKKVDTVKKSKDTVKKTTVKETKPVENSKKVNDKKEPIKNNELKASEKKYMDSMNYKDDADFGGDEIRKLLIIIGAVCAIMLVFYFITDGVVKNKKDKPKEETPEVKVEPEIDYEHILMGSLFDQDEDSYYVLAYTEDDAFYPVYEAYLEKYNELEDHLKVYKVNLSDGFNKSYIADESYLDGSDIDEIKVTGTTLIRIEEGYIYLSFEGVDEIIGRLKYITE